MPNRNSDWNRILLKVVFILAAAYFSLPIVLGAVFPFNPKIDERKFDLNSAEAKAMQKIADHATSQFRDTAILHFISMACLILFFLVSKRGPESARLVVPQTPVIGNPVPIP